MADVLYDEQHLTAFVSSLCGRRDKAITGRRSSGIENEWLIDEESYQGIDEANRMFYRSWIAGIKHGQPVRAEPAGNRSTVFLNITRPYCDSAAARLADMLLPVDDDCFKIKTTPIADLDPETSAMLAQAGIDWSRVQEQVQEEADTSAELMDTQISDLLVECHWHGEVREVIEDAARIGTGVLKGPVAVKRVSKKWIVVDGVGKLEVREEIKPGSIRIDPWNFYPDAACGENIHNGNEVWERAYITAKQLRDMADMPGYDRAAIVKCLQDGPKPTTQREGGDRTIVPADHVYEMWTFYGTVSENDALTSQLKYAEGLTTINAMGILINDMLVKISLNTLDTGEFPYDVLAWQRRPGIPWGMGVASHVRTPQRMLNAACRAMMDNAGMVAAPQEVIGNGITPDDGLYEIKGRKLWRAESDVMDISKAFYCYTPTSHINEFQEIIKFARDIAEQTTGMPMLLQGQQENTSDGADTLGGMQLLQNNATGVLRRLAKRFDDYLTKPHITRYYNWLMQYSERQDIKGDFQIDVRGSSALIERDSQKQFMFAALAYAKDPQYGINPYQLFSELAKADRMDPKRIQFGPEEYQQRITNEPSDVDKAKAALDNAKAMQAEAAAFLAKIQGLFSAINTANLVAANPAIAPAADATAKSAGFKDADAPPVIGQVPPGNEPDPDIPPATPDEGPAQIPGNTHPELPPPAGPGPMPKPPSPGSPPMMQPDVNAAKGIHGGQR